MKRTASLLIFCLSAILSSAVRAIPPDPFGEAGGALFFHLGRHMDPTPLPQSLRPGVLAPSASGSILANAFHSFLDRSLRFFESPALTSFATAPLLQDPMIQKHDPEYSEWGGYPRWAATTILKDLAKDKYLSPNLSSLVNPTGLSVSFSLVGPLSQQLGRISAGGPVWEAEGDMQRFAKAGLSIVGGYYFPGLGSLLLGGLGELVDISSKRMALQFFGTQNYRQQLVVDHRALSESAKHYDFTLPGDLYREPFLVSFGITEPIGVQMTRTFTQTELAPRAMPQHTYPIAAPIELKPLPDFHLTDLKPLQINQEISRQLVQPIAPDIMSRLVQPINPAIFKQIQGPAVDFSNLYGN